MNNKHAVVIGGSVGGLCAARVLSDYFGRVTIIDHDTLPQGAAHRKGVSQSRHPHVLLDRGRQELTRLFPGFVETILSRGALDLEPGWDLAALQPERWAPRRHDGHMMMFASRILIESVIREIVAKLGRVKFIEAMEAVGLVLTNDSSPRVCGVKVVNKDDGSSTTIDADLVVDATGRSSSLPKWLEELGFPKLPREVVDADAGYSTLWYQAPPPQQRPAQWWWQGAFLNPTFEQSARRDEDLYFGLLFPIEGNRWIVTVASWGGRPLPKDHESFASLLSRLRSPLIAEACALATPISPVFYRRGMQNIWNHYEKWEGRLGGYIATGDAVCAFNPVYGQGMTSAAVCAGILGEALRSGDPGDPEWAAAFFTKQAQFLGQPWSLAVARDRQAVRTLETTDPLQKQAAEVFGRIMSEGGEYPEIGEALFDVFNLNRSPESLMGDPKFLEVVAKIMSAPPKPPVSPDAVEAYPPQTAAAA